jgi:predicted nucleic acid-binding Zn ribbon protein
VRHCIYCGASLREDEDTCCDDCFDLYEREVD